jgi:hypothetical protein
MRHWFAVDEVVLWLLLEGTRALRRVNPLLYCPLPC